MNLAFRLLSYVFQEYDTYNNVFFLLKDNNGRTLSDFMNLLHGINSSPTGWVVVKAAANDVFANRYLFLVSCGGSSIFPSGSILVSKKKIRDEIE